MKFRVLLGALLAVLVFAGAASPALAQYPPTVGAGRVNRSTVKQCQCVQFSGDGFKPGSAITIIDRHPNGTEHVVRTVVADSRGAFRTRVCFDEHSPEGRHTLIARGQDPAGAPIERHATVVVSGETCYQRGDEIHGDRFNRPDDNDGNGGLPFSGSNTTLPMLLLGFGLVVAGSGVVLVFRRRPYVSY